jgi:hypothetical protein
MPAPSPLIEETPMPADRSARRPSEDWIAIVRKSGTPEFATAFVANPVFHAREGVRAEAITLRPADR